MAAVAEDTALASCGHPGGRKKRFKMRNLGGS